MQEQSNPGTPLSATTVIRWYEFHRWLNPFAKQRARMATQLTPREIEEALRPRYARYFFRPSARACRNHPRHPAGFALRLAGLGSRQLRVRYVDCPGATTVLSLEYGVTTRELARTTAIAVAWTVVMVATLLLYSHLPYLEAFRGQPGYRADWFGVMVLLLTATLLAAYGAGSWKSRAGLSHYQDILAVAIRASKTQP